MNRRQAAFDLLKGANPVPVPDQENDAVPIRRPVPTLLTSAVVAVVALVLVGVFLNPLNNDQEPATQPIPTPATDPSVSTTTSPELLEPAVSRFVLSDGTEIATGAGGVFQIEGDWVHVFDKALEELASSPALGASPAERDMMLSGCPAGERTCEQPLGGLTITLTIDLGAQSKAQGVHDTWDGTVNLDELSRELLVVDNRTGAISAWVTTVDSQPHPAGSLLSVPIAASALESGFGLDSMWDSSSPQTFVAEDGTSLDCANAGGGGSGEMSLEEGLYRSVKVVGCGIASRVGLDALNETSEWFGVIGATDLTTYLDGSMQVSAVDLTRGFTTIANFGTAVTPHVVTNVTSPREDVRWEGPEPEPKAVDPALASTLHQALAVVPTSTGTAPRANIGSPQGGKTGLVEEFRGAWYAGYTPEFTAVVWVGAPDGGTLINVEIREQTYSRVFGGSVPAPMWAELMLQLVDPEADFPDPPPGMDRYLDSD